MNTSSVKCVISKKASNSYEAFCNQVFFLKQTDYASTCIVFQPIGCYIVNLDIAIFNEIIDFLVIDKIKAKIFHNILLQKQPWWTYWLIRIIQIKQRPLIFKVFHLLRDQVPSCCKIASPRTSLLAPYLGIAPRCQELFLQFTNPFCTVYFYSAVSMT